MKRVRSVLVGSLLLVGCSGRDVTVESTAPDSGADAGADTNDSATTTEGPEIDASAHPSPFDIFDAFPFPDGPLGTCLACLRDSCAMPINQCLNQESCRTGLLCTIEVCLPAAVLSDAGLNLGCALNCFGNDLASALGAETGVQCVQTSCTASCTSAAQAITDGI